MSRHVIAKEGMPSLLPDTWLAPGSLWMDSEERVPVTTNFNWEQPPVGIASDLQRNEETGEVSVEVHWFDETFTLDEDLYESSFWATHLEEERVEATDDIPAHRSILKAKVRGVSIVPIAANPRGMAEQSQDLQGT